jgi:allantoin racemase
MKITVITPTIKTTAYDGMLEAMRSERYDPDVQIEHLFIDRGPACVDTEIRAAQAVPGLLEKAVQAQAAGSAGIVINCTSDPGLFAVREAVDIPVVGTGIVAMHTASLLGTRFGIIDVSYDTRAYVEGQIFRYRLHESYGVLKSTGIAVLEIERDAARATQAVVDASLEIVRQNNVDVLILGCGVFATIVRDVEARLRAAGVSVPLINPLPHAIHCMAALIRGGLSHSKVAWPTPRTVPPV